MRGALAEQPKRETRQEAVVAGRAERSCGPQRASSPAFGDTRTPASAEGCWADPALAAWVRRNERLATRFSAEVFRGDPCARPFYAFVVHVAGDYLWARQRPRPEWAALDVDGLRRSVLCARLDLDAVERRNFGLALSRFYLWMARTGRLPVRAAGRVIQRLQGGSPSIHPLPSTPLTASTTEA